MAHQMVSLGTDQHPSSLHDELESIFRHNVEWQDEQVQREDLLKKMADYYQTNLSTVQHTNSLNPDDQQSISEEEP